MGGIRSGKPPSRERLEAALKAVENGQSLRSAAKQYHIDRTTLALYRDGRMVRRKERRCPDCGGLVMMPCRRCSTEMKVAAMRLKKRRLAAVRRKACV